MDGGQVQCRQPNAGGGDARSVDRSSLLLGGACEHWQAATLYSTAWHRPCFKQNRVRRAGRVVSTVTTGTECRSPPLAAGVHPEIHWPQVKQPPLIEAHSGIPFPASLTPPGSSAPQWIAGVALAAGQAQRHRRLPGTAGRHAVARWLHPHNRSPSSDTWRQALLPACPGRVGSGRLGRDRRRPSGQGAAGRRTALLTRPPAGRWRGGRYRVQHTAYNLRTLTYATLDTAVGHADAGAWRRRAPARARPAGHYRHLRDGARHRGR